MSQQYHVKLNDFNIHLYSQQRFLSRYSSDGVDNMKELTKALFQITIYHVYMHLKSNISAFAEVAKD